MTRLDIAKSCKSIISNAVEKVIAILDDNSLRLNEDAYSRNMYGRLWTNANGHIVDNTFDTVLNMANEIYSRKLTDEQLATHFTSVEEIKAEIQKRRDYDSPKSRCKRHLAEVKRLMEKYHVTKEEVGDDWKQWDNPIACI